MKHFLIAMTFFAGSASLSAFAQTSAPAQPANDTAQVAQIAAPAQEPLYGQSMTQKTHA
jgi:uncharacterized protein YjlB